MRHDKRLAVIEVYQNFNPRTPCGVRQHQSGQQRRPGQFQSTHPVWGATFLEGQEGYQSGISIHAPRVGCDDKFQFSGCPPYDFNPRTPCGVRPDAAMAEVDALIFQSTHPVWGATFLRPGGFPRGSISIHAPRVGCDYSYPGCVDHVQLFQSTHPVWGATVKLFRLFSIVKISIHAPRVGCDVL